MGRHTCSFEKEWIQDKIEYYDDAIVDLAIKLGSINSNPSNKLRTQVSQNYFNFMANVILGSEPKNN